jgi:hypothetical protein
MEANSLGRTAPIAKSLALHSQYYTSPKECHQLLSIADQVWGLEGKRALEPSVGSGNFIRAAEVAGFNLEWVTNELFPEGSNFQPTFNKDFLELTPEEVGDVDFVIGNPPFSGRMTIDGRPTSCAMGFVLLALRHADRVAFVLPGNILRTPWLAMLPKDVEVVARTEMEVGEYHLGGHGGGEGAKVPTTCVLIERTGCDDNGYDLDLSPLPGFEILDDYEGATHAIMNWGSIAGRALDGSWGRKFPYASELPVRVTDLRVEALLASSAMGDYVSHFTSAAPRASEEEILHLMNGLWGQIYGAK